MRISPDPLTTLPVFLAQNAPGSPALCNRRSAPIEFPVVGGFCSRVGTGNGPKIACTIRSLDLRLRPFGDYLFCRYVELSKFDCSSGMIPALNALGDFPNLCLKRRLKWAASEKPHSKATCVIAFLVLRSCHRA